jgi:hypothetical protein
MSPIDGDSVDCTQAYAWDVSVHKASTVAHRGLVDVNASRPWNVPMLRQVLDPDTDTSAIEDGWTCEQHVPSRFDPDAVAVVAATVTPTS